MPLVVTPDEASKNFANLEQAMAQFDPVFQQAGFLKVALGEDRQRRVLKAHRDAKINRLRSTIHRCRTSLRAGVHKTIDGIGQHKYKIPVSLHAELIQQFGEDCFQFPEFRKDFEKEFPECCVGYAGPRKILSRAN